MMTEDDLIQAECQKSNPFLNFMVLVRLHFNKQTFFTYVNSISMPCQRKHINHNWSDINFESLINKNHNFDTIAESANNTNVIDTGWSQWTV